MSPKLATSMVTPSIVSDVDLFTVLREDPKALVELDQEAGAKVSLMQEVVDVAELGDLLFLVGRGGTTGPAVLLSTDRAGTPPTRFIVSLWSPVSLSVDVDKTTGAARAAVLVRNPIAGGAPQLVVWSNKHPTTVATVQLAAGHDPVSVRIELDGRAALVLYREALQRVPLDGVTQPGPPVTLGALLPKGEDGLEERATTQAPAKGDRAEAR